MTADELKEVLFVKVESFLEKPCTSEDIKNLSEALKFLRKRKEQSNDIR